MTPEMKRSRLENVILKILVLGYDDVDGFLAQLLDPPSRESVALSNQALRDIGALDKDDSLTDLGHTLGQLPLDPQLGKMMVLAAALSCLDPVLSVVTALENKSPFCLTSRAREAAQAVDQLAADTASDHLAVANAVACWDGIQVHNFNPIHYCENFSGSGSGSWGSSAYCSSSRLLLTELHLAAHSAFHGENEISVRT